MADRLAAFGGAIALNREVDIATAELIVETYAEVVAAPEFAPGVLDRFARWKNLRVMRIANMARLAEYASETFVDFKSLVDGGLVVQTSFVPNTRVRRATSCPPLPPIKEGITASSASRRPRSTTTSSSAGSSRRASRATR